MRGGWRWPAEWEPHAATWLAWPHNAETWPGRLESALDEFVVFVRTLCEREPVRLLVADGEMEAAATRRLIGGGVDPERNVEMLRIPTNDAWIRDYGPLFVARGRERRVLDFGFDSWGRKYPPWDLDDAVPRRAAARLELAHHTQPFVLEGGSIDGNGRGTVLTTESCLLCENREPGGGRTREQMEARLEHALGASRVLWLARGIAGDDTDGHVDDIARFVDSGIVVAALADPSDPNHAALAENLDRLRRGRDQDDKALSVVTLPMPPIRRAGELVCPASYANFYLANGVVLVPTFGVPSDERALDILRELLVGRDVVGIPCTNLVAGLGALHCLSQQEPAEPAFDPA